jgi:hypothetical protein
MMAKKILVKPTKEPVKALIPEKYQGAIYIGLLLVAIFVFFSGAIFSGGFNASDNIASFSFKNILEEAKRSGDFPLWIPNIFAGLPGYAAILITGDRSWDIIAQFFYGVTNLFGSIFSSDAARVISYYMIYAVGMYLLIRTKKHSRFVAFVTGFAAVFSTYVITWVMIGHNTKPLVLCMVPYAIMFMENLREKFSLIFAALLIFSLHIMFEGGQQQIAFYGLLIFAIYLLYEFFGRIVKKQEPLKVLKPALMIIAAGGFAFLMSADRYLAVFEYTPYSTRGSAPIVHTEKQHQDASGGNDYSYATMWSYSPQEAINFFVPSYFGHGIRDYQVKGQRENNKVSTYWGQKESEDSPPYMGIIILGLAILGVIMYRKDVFVQFLVISAIFSFFLAMGKNLPFLYDLFYNYFPSFNKFRAPSMALVIMHFAVPILAGYGLTGALRWRENFGKGEKRLAMGAIIFSGAFLVAGLLFAAMKSSYITSVTASEKIGPYLQNVPDLPEFIFNSAFTDWMLGGLMLAAAAVLLYMFAMKKIPYTALSIGLVALIIFDLWRIDYRRMDISKTTLEKEVFTSQDAIYKPLQKEMAAGVFRIFDMNGNVPAYYGLQNINGYHSAKLRIYQDLLDVANTQGYEGSTSVLFNPFLWNIMNVKYIIYPDQKTNKPMVYPNPEALPRAFFVNRVEQASQMDILNHLKNKDFVPRDLAYIEEPLPVKLDTADTNSVVTIETYKNQYIKLKANAVGNNLLFVSEIYYPVGWKAYIDGVETPIIKTNYAFRSVIVPPGEHTIEFKFTSKTFETGKTMSLMANIATLLLLAGGVALVLIKRKKENPSE